MRGTRWSTRSPTSRPGPGTCSSSPRRSSPRPRAASSSWPTVVPRPEAVAFAERWDRDARQVEVVLRESVAIVRMERGVIISRTRHGYVCANAGVDASNVGAHDEVTLLPDDSDALRTGDPGAHRRRPRRGRGGHRERLLRTALALGHHRRRTGRGGLLAPRRPARPPGCRGAHHARDGRRRRRRARIDRGAGVGQDERPAARPGPRRTPAAG